MFSPRAARTHRPRVAGRGLAPLAAGLILLAACGTAEPGTAVTSETVIPTTSSARPTPTATASVPALPTATTAVVTVTATTGAGPSTAPEPSTAPSTDAVPAPTTEAPPPGTTEAPTPPPVTSAPATTARPAEPTGSATGPMTKKVVVVDPGHNGANGANPQIINQLVDAGFGQRKACNTTGTSTNDGYKEATFNWKVAVLVKAELEKRGVTVLMTRDSNDGVGPCVDKRAAVGNDNQADAVLSIHGDGSGQGDRGFYVMTAEVEPAGADVAAASDRLAAAVRDELVAEGLSPANYLGSNGLWQRSDLAGLNLSQVPTVMVEMGNMRDSVDAALMTSEAGQQQIAAGLADGVIRYLIGG